MVLLGMVSGELSVNSSAESCGFPGVVLMTFPPVLLGAWPARARAERADAHCGAAFPLVRRDCLSQWPGRHGPRVCLAPRQAPRHFSRAGMSRGAQRSRATPKALLTCPRGRRESWCRGARPGAGARVRVPGPCLPSPDTDGHLPGGGARSPRLVKISQGSVLPCIPAGSLVHASAASEARLLVLPGRAALARGSSGWLLPGGRFTRGGVQLAAQGGEVGCGDDLGVAGVTGDGQPCRAGVELLDLPGRVVVAQDRGEYAGVVAVFEEFPQFGDGLGGQDYRVGGQRAALRPEPPGFPGEFP